MDWLLFWEISVWILFMERLIGRKLNFFIFLEIMIRSQWNTALDVFFASYDDDFLLLHETLFFLIFGSNSLNGVQLVPQGSPRWIGLQLDYIEWWVFPVFKPTYGLSKAVAVDYCFPPLYLTFSFNP